MCLLFLQDSLLCKTNVTNFKQLKEIMLLYIKNIGNVNNNFAHSKNRSIDLEYNFLIK